MSLRDRMLVLAGLLVVGWALRVQAGDATEGVPPALRAAAFEPLPLGGDQPPAAD